ncbi:pentapeptide repeat-containing protein [Geminocystis sp. GBBB08]|uniref:pentapeptide repeat-containing protein n=1 Tax=Geminocystis sp. GBBB08 TaxID=2604140 RepID=UPI0027E36788|nr:pentapeptide repeat-containing protein [Geminocystis sp. GBBB08]MBL1210334.1 DNA/RNA helicase [Geminocystis sp. GBBB08]
MNNHSNEDKFIVTELFDNKGEKGEYFVWEIIKIVFKDRVCLAYWRYPIFSEKGRRKEVDILIIDQQLGLIIIEVKSVKIEQILSINGHFWQYQNFYINGGNPYQQAENQLFNLLDYLKNEPNLSQKVTAKVVIALPYIKEEEWQKKGFNKLPSNPPIIFQDDLEDLSLFLNKLVNLSPVISGNKLDEKQWNLLLSIIAGKQVLETPKYRVLTKEKTKGKILQDLASYSNNLDLTQEKIVKEISNYIQEIRGIAGAGKTLILCQKAAYLHLKYPHWKIVIVFFTRSLYEQIISLIDKWLRYFSQGKITYSNYNKNLLILHGWGGKNQLGLYSLICQKVKEIKLGVNDTNNQSPNEALAEACYYLLKNKKIPALFDVILIDEAQDFISQKWIYEGKQPFFWLVYQSLKSSNTLDNTQKKLIYAYDEMQCLNHQLSLSAFDLFGENSSQKLLTSIFANSYRTPNKILNTAFAMSMGWFRYLGILRIINDEKSWQEIGYKIIGKIAEGETITIEKINSKFLHPLTKFYQEEVIKFQTFYSRQQELNYLAKAILTNLRYDGLQPTKQILVIILGNSYFVKELQSQCQEILQKKAIEVFIPHHHNPNKFWEEGMITVTGIHQAKGNEAQMVYIIGLDQVAKEESNISLRNQLFVALTRSKAWVNISGVGKYVMYDELKKVLTCDDSFTFTLRQQPLKIIKLSKREKLIDNFALGCRNFQNIDLSGENLENLSLNKINFIGANLQGVNFQGVSLQKGKLINADLTDSNFSQGNLSYCKLMGANLTGVNFSKANLRGADFSNAIITNANFNEADLTDTIFDDIRPLAK